MSTALGPGPIRCLGPRTTTVRLPDPDRGATGGPASPLESPRSVLRDRRFAALADALQAPDRRRTRGRGRQAGLGAGWDAVWGRVRRWATVGLVQAAAGRGWWPLVPVLAELPRWRVEVPDTAAGHRMAGKYRGRDRGVPRAVAVSVLAIPRDPQDYLRGRSRQAVRTNNRRARGDGIRCHTLDPAQARARLADVVPDDWEGIVPTAAEELDAGLVTGHAAITADGATAALALTSHAGPLARLDLMLSGTGRASADARYLLSTHLITELAAAAPAGVRALAVESALLVPAGLRHFQHLLGFGQTTLEITSAASPADRAGPDRPHRATPART